MRGMGCKMAQKGQVYKFGVQKPMPKTPPICTPFCTPSPGTSHPYGGWEADVMTCIFAAVLFVSLLSLGHVALAHEAHQDQRWTVASDAYVYRSRPLPSPAAPRAIMTPSIATPTIYAIVAR